MIQFIIILNAYRLSFWEISEMYQVYNNKYINILPTLI